MTDSDDDPPDGVIPFGHVMQTVIAQQLRKMYEDVLSEELPERILALLQQFEGTKEEKLPQENKAPKEDDLATEKV